MMVRASSLAGPQEIDVLIERRRPEAGLIEEIETFADLGAACHAFGGQVDVHLHGLSAGTRMVEPPAASL